MTATIGAASVLPAELAHTYGVGGVSRTQANAAARRGLMALREAWPEVLAQMMRRALQQALQEAVPDYWIRRAEYLEQVGTEWADGAARNCRRAAWLLATEGLSDDVLAELDDFMAVV